MKPGIPRITVRIRDIELVDGGKLMKKPVIILFLILTTALSCTTKYRNIHSFETVWQTVNQVHYDPTFGGVDWKAAHERYKPQIVAAAENKKESFLLINQMLFELNLSHLLAVYPDDLKKHMPVLFAEGGIGVDCDPDSAANHSLILSAINRRRSARKSPYSGTSPSDGGVCERSPPRGS